MADIGNDDRLRELYDLLESEWEFRINDIDDEQGKTLRLKKSLDDDGIFDIESSLLENIQCVFEVEDYEISFLHPEGEIWIKFFDIETGVDDR